MYKIVRKFLFLFDAETAHKIAMALLKVVSPLLIFKTKSSPVIVAGIKFPNRVGLAAGFDKNAKWITQLSKLGFGHIEIGTVTPLPQPGNEKPRLFRLLDDECIINRMGFNNDGSVKISNRLKKLQKSGVVVGGNIGKNKWTEANKAVFDYVHCFDQLADFVDYFVVNVSSPNTPGLRILQDKAPLFEILQSLQKRAAQKNIKKPIFLKIAPDLTQEQILDVLEVVEKTGIPGLVVANTTISREGLKTTTTQTGGLSGPVLKQKTLEIIKFIRKSNKSIAIIGVGGISSKKDAQDYIDAGADLIQIYTGFIYKGPKLIKQISQI